MRLVLLALILVHAASARRHHHHHAPPEKERLIVDATTGIHYNPYSKHHPGRHVCTSLKNPTPKPRQVLCKPIYRNYQQPCHGNQLCAGVKVVYETTYKDLATSKSGGNKPYFHCCPGWTQVNNRSHGCNKAVCATPCRNGGSCVKPDVCVCPKGFSGSYCESDVDECREQKPCDQICYNTPGSYHCQCRENFVLKEDGQSCHKEDDDETAFEAKDLEFDLLDKRIVKLETMFGEMHKNDPTKQEINRINTQVKEMSNSLNVLDARIRNLEPQKNDLLMMKLKIKQLENRVVNIDDLNYKFEKMKTCLFLNKICV